MKTIGLIGGTTWISTLEYYQLINQETNKIRGGLESARILLYSLNFADVRPPADNAEWDKIAAYFGKIAKKLESGGADCILICANTYHIIADNVQSQIKVPLIHIGDAIAKEIQKYNIRKVGLLGTKPTMEQNFIQQQIKDNLVEVIIPTEPDREFIHWSVFEEFGKGVFSENTRDKYTKIIYDLIALGASGIILGCTEMPILLRGVPFRVPIFNTTVIHVKAAVDFSLQYID